MVYRLCCWFGRCTGIEGTRDYDVMMSIAWQRKHRYCMKTAKEWADFVTTIRHGIMDGMTLALHCIRINR